MSVKILHIIFIICLYSSSLIGQQLSVIYERIQPNPFEQLEKPIGITVFPFTKEESYQVLTQQFYSELTKQQEIHNYFTIYPDKVVMEQLGLNEIEELEAANSVLLSRLHNILGIDFVVIGAVKKSANLQFTIFLISTQSAEIVSYFDIQESTNSNPIIDAVKIFSELLRPVYKDIDIPDGMLFVDGGWFEMGSNLGRANSKPVHRVFIDDFFIDKYEVTIKAYSEFCNATGRQMPEQPEYHKDEHPVVNVTWKDASDYANWKGRRLPTEAEWEYAALGTNSKSHQYSGNSILENVGWYSGNSNSVIHQVGKLEPNGFGIYDLSGNAWEWCSDWYSSNYYSSGEGISPTGPTAGKEKVLRGGSYDDDKYFCRIKYRNKNFPDRKFSNYGFRCVIDLVE
ncbi:MAG: formylglycine-generating enzyme family protein [Ignavibacteria bacterium]|nr:formylglycine-generating enzyme family protein [Ignavibacteria bacterium]